MRMMDGVFTAAVAPFTRSGRSLPPSIVTEAEPTSPGPASSIATVVPTRHRSPPSYGATNSNWEGPSRSPERTRRDTLNRVPEESAVNFNGNDEDSGSEIALEEQGLYRGSYKSLILLQSLTIFTLVLATFLLALLPALFYHPSRTPRSPYPYELYLPYPLPELLVSTGLWALSYLLRIPIYSLFESISQSAVSTVLSTMVQTVVTTGLRIMTFPILLIPHYMVYPFPTWHDLTFGRVWWSALGWAIAESLVAIKQGYDAIALYRDVLVTVQENPVLAAHGKDFPQTSRNSSLTGTSDNIDHEEQSPLVENSRSHLHLSLESSLQLQIDRDFEQLLALKGREELEEIYGVPIIQIPVFISCLQRVNSLLLALGLTLLLSAAYIRSSVPGPRDPVLYPIMAPHEFASMVATLSFSATPSALKITLPIVFLIQLFLNILHTPLLLPKIGIHTVVYIALLVSLGSFFSGLGVWHALT